MYRVTLEVSNYATIGDASVAMALLQDMAEALAGEGNVSCGVFNQDLDRAEAEELGIDYDALDAEVCDGEEEN